MDRHRFRGPFSSASAKSSSVLSRGAPGSFSSVITLDSVPSSLTAVNDNPPGCIAGAPSSSGGGRRSRRLRLPVIG